MKTGRSGTLLKERESEAPRINGSSAVLPSARVPLRARQRKPGYVALGVVLIVGLGAVGGLAYTSAGAKTPVVVVIRQIPAGHVVGRADLSTIDVSGGVVAIAGANLGSVLGETATVDLLPNTLLQRSMVTGGPAFPADQAQVGVAVTGGQIPADGLVPGDTVEVLQLPGKAAAAAAGSPAVASVLVARATVFSARQNPSEASGTLVTLVVPASAAPGVATASSDSLVALVKVAS